MQSCLESPVILALKIILWIGRKNILIFERVVLYSSECTSYTEIKSAKGNNKWKSKNRFPGLYLDS